MLTVHLAGIMYFHGCDERVKRIFVPDGTKGLGEIPAHYASIWVEPDDIDEENTQWFEDPHRQQVTVPDDVEGQVVVTVFEYRIPYPVTLTFPDGDGGGPAYFANLEAALQKIEELAPGFRVDRRNPKTIAQIPLRSGTLEAFEFKNVAVVQWTIDEPSSLAITAATDCETKIITLKKPAEGRQLEVVFGNTSDLLNPARSVGEDHEHYKLYAQLREGRKADDIDWKTRKRVLQQLAFKHDYLTGLRSGSQIPDPGCEGTCCRPTGQE